MLTYDVDIWSIRQRKGRPKPFELRWRVGERSHSRSFKLKPQAEGRQSELLAALRNREQYDEETGLPASEFEALTTPTWYEHATAYVLMKWPKAAAKHRASIAETFATITPAFASSSRGAPDAVVLRRALYGWAFRAAQDTDGNLRMRYQVETPPADIAAALTWISANTVKMTEVGKSERLRSALDALSKKLNGMPAADNTVNRKRMVLSNALRYAVERGTLASNPLGRVDWTGPDKDDEVDFRYVPNPDQAAALIDAVRQLSARGAHMAAFFGCLYYAAMRPSEIAALRAEDCKLPESGWGELVLAGSQPEVGSGWTNDGQSFEQRGLKRRARTATRSVPIPPVLTAMLRGHRERFGVADDGRLFRAAKGGRVRSTEYCELWDSARLKALSAKEAKTPLADVPYSLRHAGVSLWINSGVDPMEVAQRAGHSLAVLFRFYAKILKGQQSRANDLIERGLSGG
ncbi:tyrosine-type recombinase/integrase [Streptomyces sp. NP-1717]|uniref:tyrosine-type recombinase/integrase n=1 Tax=Streptomyces sp. NP-1717 TaxID=2704470 RepID=UPI001F5C3FC3|nr:tyrosine-type recombinase/integrase [Streptomyces sp. NP-1717]MCI3225952.1 tyrosine-type recombinase/integrase [Streptomyces sp. NP-1717]